MLILPKAVWSFFVDVTLNQGLRRLNFDSEVRLRIRRRGPLRQIVYESAFGPLRTFARSVDAAVQLS